MVSCLRLVSALAFQPPQRCHSTRRGRGYGPCEGSRSLHDDFPFGFDWWTIRGAFDQCVSNPGRELALDVLFSGSCCWRCLCGSHFHHSRNLVHQKTQHGALAQAISLGVDVFDPWLQPGCLLPPGIFGHLGQRDLSSSDLVLTDHWNFGWVVSASLIWFTATHSPHYQEYCRPIDFHPHIH
jgi:hypothetical protein